MKKIVFLGNSLDQIKAFPLNLRRDAGYQLDKVQNGFEPDNWKPVSAIGSGVKEIRIRDASGIYRVMYVTRIEAKIYVLHAFNKKTQKTPRKDIEIVRKRLKLI